MPLPPLPLLSAPLAEAAGEEHCPALLELTAPAARVFIGAAMPVQIEACVQLTHFATAAVPEPPVLSVPTQLAHEGERRRDTAQVPQTSSGAMGVVGR